MVEWMMEEVGCDWGSWLLQIMWWHQIARGQQWVESLHGLLPGFNEV